MAERVFTCSAGSFSGVEENDCINISPIRYATCERFGEPKPYVYKKGVHKLNERCPICVQLDSKIDTFLSGTKYEKAKQLEDPQVLAITVPKNVKTNEKLPVMVWFHGGAYINGGTAFYDRTLFAKEQRVIMVGVNYRLGILGFSKNRNGELANNGVLDAIEAMRWVNNNIEAFGGDPKNITIFGISAGADIVRCFILSRVTGPLFRRAIIQSDPALLTIKKDKIDKQILDKVNSIPLDAPIEEYKKAQGYLLKHIKARSIAKYMPFGPHFGVYPLPKVEDIEERIKVVAHQHELLIGTTRRESSLFLAANKHFRRLGYLNPWVREKIIRYYTHKVFEKPSEEFAILFGKAGGTVYTYDFLWQLHRKHTFLGACHTIDTLALFGPRYYKDDSVMLMGMKKEEIIEEGKPLRAVWSDFARTGKIELREIADMVKFN